jgi:chorismate synthase
MNSFGRKFRVSIFGESHGELIGVVLDGVPAGLELSEQDFEQDILRRKSGARGTTPRKEEDKPQIVSGVFEGHTTGAPLTLVFRNNNTHSSDYEQFAAMPRPGHADLTAAIKWDDCQDPRGSGHFSGRLTLPIVAAGVVAKKVLADATILDDAPVNEINARIVQLGGVNLETTGDTEMSEEVQRVLEQAIKDGEDYELLFTLSPHDFNTLQSHTLPQPVFPIGKLSTDTATPLSQGWQHFRA